jgi:hypothetical protein
MILRKCTGEDYDRNDRRVYKFECGHTHLGDRAAIDADGKLTLTPRVGVVSECDCCTRRGEETAQASRAANPAAMAQVTEALLRILLDDASGAILNEVLRRENSARARAALEAAGVPIPSWVSVVSRASKG